MMTLGLSLALGSAPVSAPAGPNPNLLLWTDELDNAVWVKTNCSVNPDGEGVADELFSTAPSATCRQTSTTAATTGAAVTASLTPGAGAYVHGEVAGTFDGTLYTFSCEARDAGGGEPLTLRLERAGGFLRVGLEEPVGDGDCFVRSLQLEVGLFTSYQHRGGT